MKDSREKPDIKVKEHGMNAEPLSFRFRDQVWTLGKGPLIMGVLNVTPDSFSDGSDFLDTDAACAHARRMAEEGASLIDIGGESTRPGAKPVDVSTELERVVPVIRKTAGATSVPLSIDTQKSEVAEAALEAGASIVNDVSALQQDPQMAEVIRHTGAGCILMHMRGTPETMQKNVEYQDVVGEIKTYLSEALQNALDGGIERERIMLDPGIGFGKSVEHNLRLMWEIPAFRALARPVLIGPSRKSFIGKLSGVDDPQERVPGTSAAVTVCVLRGADVVRVHDVKELKQAVDVATGFFELSACNPVSMC